MTNGLKPYPEYKDSGVPWLGDVPAHWEVKRNKLFLREINDRSQDGTEDLLTVSQYTGVTRRRENVNEEETLLSRAASLIGYKRVRPGDLVMNIMLAWNGSLGVSAVAGITSPAYCVFRANPTVDIRYLHYLLRTPLFTGIFKTVSTGVVESRLRLYPEVFLRLYSLLPPQSEQSAIVRCLDYANRRIERYIRAKRKLISLLNEQKQVMINHFVTQGIEGSPRQPIVTPHGRIPWLDSVPKHWQVQSSRRLFSARKELAQPGDVQLAATQAYGVIPQEEFEQRVGRRVVKIFMHLEKRRHVEKDDFVISMRSFEGGLERAWTSGCIRSSYVVLKPIIPIDVGYYSYLFKSAGYIQALRGTSNFIRDGQDLNYSNFCLVDLPVPPLDEQKAIADRLDRATESINVAINRASKEVDLIREYRTRLIADVVTGKIDVREAAQQLSAEAIEPEMLSEVEALAEEDEDTEAEELETVVED
jgi:type I restriction enzyme S subunit